MTKAAAYYNFWSQFGIPAFDESSVPDGSDAVGLKIFVHFSIYVFVFPY